MTKNINNPIQLEFNSIPYTFGNGKFFKLKNSENEIRKAIIPFSYMDNFLMNGFINMILPFVSYKDGFIVDEYFNPYYENEFQIEEIFFINWGGSKHIVISTYDDESETFNFYVFREF